MQVLFNVCIICDGAVIWATDGMVRFLSQVSEKKSRKQDR